MVENEYNRKQDNMNGMAEQGWKDRVNGCLSMAKAAAGRVDDWSWDGLRA